MITWVLYWQVVSLAKLYLLSLCKRFLWCCSDRIQYSSQAYLGCCCYISCTVNGTAWKMFQVGVVMGCTEQQEIESGLVRVKVPCKALNWKLRGWGLVAVHCQEFMHRCEGIIWCSGMKSVQSVKSMWNGGFPLYVQQIFIVIVFFPMHTC